VAVSDDGTSSPKADADRFVLAIPSMGEHAGKVVRIGRVFLRQIPRWITRS
jgi:hypothetical protein